MHVCICMGVCVCTCMRMYVCIYIYMFKLGRTHEKQWIRRSESTSAKREWIWIYESTAFECVLRLNTPQINCHFLMIGCLVVDIF